MPIYEYQCRACGHQFETIQKISEEPLKECPACHKDSLEKLISATSFQLKGTGWYATDFRDKGKPPKKENKPEDANPSQADGKKDSNGSSSGSDSSTNKAAG